MRRIALCMLVSVLALVGCAEEQSNQAKTKKTAESDAKPAEPVIIPISSDLQFHGEAQVQENQVHFTLSLENTGENPAYLQFSSGHQFEIVVSEQGKGEIYRYSNGKMFTQALIDLPVEPGETKIWEDTWKGQLEPEKTYIITFQLLPRTINEKEVKPSMLTDTKILTVERSKETN
ncbi:BsuPI-related putative proteinase inhibitor [Bacillus sp. 165]|uniref:BsuPI-related putative proteinase inhibitor n=1 Tax=Bacillus sp. 165 TaxID=1529117 RepID=UPI001ADA74B8|nr:BsuPI-related putative proteinase inhibitor [Bacillus sp. 165]MBO9129683.1 hypothetical protein [Bacillus sp. 165]